MKCRRCSSVMVYQRFYTVDENFPGWRCVLCGEIIDQVILENRRSKRGRGNREKRRECGS
jgi:hypothetical protein